MCISYHVLQSMQQAHASLHAYRDLSGRGQDGWVRLQQAAADDSEQEQAGNRRQPSEEEQVELALVLPQDQAAASCAMPWVVQISLVQGTAIHSTSQQAQKHRCSAWPALPFEHQGLLTWNCSRGAKRCWPCSALS